MATEVVCMPWRASRERKVIYDYVKKFWKRAGYTVLEGDGEATRPFSLSAARNAAVRQASGIYDVVIVADADTIPEIGPIEQAVRIAREAGHVVYPFSEYRYLDRHHVIYNDPTTPLSSIEPIWTKTDSVGGILVTSTQTYWGLGGMDEKFEPQWGFEDNAFVAVADTLAKVIRLPGNVYSFSHEVEGAGRDWSKLNPNWWRNELYQHCWGNNKLMTELIK